MPPRPLSTYMLYYLEQKDKVVKENPGMEMTQVFERGGGEREKSFSFVF